MKNTFIPGFLLLSGAVLASAQTSAPFKVKTQFSADLKMTIEDGMTISTKMNMDGDKTRIATELQGQQIVIILRKDQKKIFNVMPMLKAYMEMPLNEQQLQTEQVLFDTTAKWEKIGTETIREQACDQYKITSKIGTVFFWANPSNQNPVRITTENKKTVIDWENFKDGAQPAELFEPPADFQKMTAPASAEIPIPGDGTAGGGRTAK